MVKIVGKPVPESSKVFQPCQLPWKPAQARGMVALVRRVVLRGPHAGCWMIDNRWNPKPQVFQVLGRPKVNQK